MLSKHSLHPIPLAPAWTAVAVMVSTTRTQSAKRPAAKRPAKGPASKRPAKKRPAAKRPAKGPAAKRPAAKRPAKGPVAKRRRSLFPAGFSDRSSGDSDLFSEWDAAAVDQDVRSVAYCSFCGHRWMSSAGRHDLFCQMDGQGPLCAIHRHRCRRVEGQPTAMNMLLCPDCVRTLCRCDARDGAVAATMNMLLPG